MEHRIRFHVAFPIIGLCASVFILAVSTQIGASLNTITGVVLLLVSVLQFTVPVVVVTQDEFQMRNLFGMTLRRVPYTLDTIDVSERVPRVEGRRVRGFSGWALDGNAIELMRADIRSRQQGQAASE